MLFEGCAVDFENWVDCSRLQKQMLQTLPSEEERFPVVTKNEGTYQVECPERVVRAVAVSGGVSALASAHIAQRPRGNWTTGS